MAQLLQQLEKNDVCSCIRMFNLLCLNIEYMTKQISPNEYKSRPIYKVVIFHDKPMRINAGINAKIA